MKALLLTLLALFAWGMEDLFLKESADIDDSRTSLKIAAVLGLIMGVALIVISPYSESRLPLGKLVMDNLFFLLVPAAYAVTMVISNIGLRYLDMSIMSPMENASGGLPVIILFVYFWVTKDINHVIDEVGGLDITGTALILAGIIALAIVQHSLFLKGGQQVSDKKRTLAKYGALALLFPLLFCLFDTFETVVCGIMLHGDERESIGQFDMIRLYTLMFLIVGIISYAALCIGEKRLYNPFRKKETPKIVAGVLETAAYISYVMAMALKPLLVAPVISSYCVLSIILVRIFLKEKLKRAQYVCIMLVIGGIVLLGISEGLSEAGDDGGDAGIKTETVEKSAAKE